MAMWSAALGRQSDEGAKAVQRWLDQHVVFGSVEHTIEFHPAYPTAKAIPIGKEDLLMNT